MKLSTLITIAGFFTALFLKTGFAVVAPEAADVRPLLIGASVPAAALQAADGSEIKASDLAAQKPTLFIFYRGGWCPFCTAHLSELMDIEDQLTAFGYQIVAISPDIPEKFQETAKDKSLSYTIYSDGAMKTAEAFGVAFRLDKATLERYKGYGIDLVANSGGKNKDVLPVPAVFLTDKAGKVVFTYVNPDYRYRVPGKVLLAAAEAALTHEPKR